MNTIFINPIAKDADSDNLSKQLKRVHTNTGNMIWSEKCKKGIKFSKEIYIDRICDKDIRDNIKNSVLVLPVSNNFSINETDFSKTFYKLARYDLKIVLVGLGVQCGEMDTPRKFVNTVPERKKRLLKTFAERCVSIGVRGEFTAQCMEYIGIHNYRIIGCPSFYSSSIVENNQRFEKANIRKVCLNFTGGKRMEHKLLELVLKSGVDSKVVMQGIRDLPQIVLEKRKLTNNLLNSCFPDNNLENGIMEDFWNNNAKIFWSIDSWEEFLAQECFSFCVGSRLHGNMLAFLNNIPSLWITHDSRTEEITELLKLPHINSKSMAKIKYIEELAEKCIYTEAFYRNFKVMRKQYISFLEENGIEHNYI